MYISARYWITIAEVKEFTSAANRVFTISEWDALNEILALNPEAGGIIPDTGGLRMIRWPAESQGKKGAVRVVYYFRDLDTPVYLIAIYEKGERFSLSAADKRAIRALVSEIAGSATVVRIGVRGAGDDAA